MTACSATKFLLLAGTISLMHCAYSAAQHRSYLRLTEQEFDGLPSDIFAQTIVSLLLICYVGSGVAGHFQPIRADLTMRERCFEHAANCSSFYHFDHRAKSLSPFFALSMGEDASGGGGRMLRNAGDSGEDSE